jgi:hypothetical protein
LPEGKNTSRSWPLDVMRIEQDTLSHEIVTTISNIGSSGHPHGNHSPYPPVTTTRNLDHPGWTVTSLKVLVSYPGKRRPALMGPLIRNSVKAGVG